MIDKNKLIEGLDYYINEKGYWVFLEKYHLDRGSCCGNLCLHCPFNHKNVDYKKNNIINKLNKN